MDDQNGKNFGNGPASVSFYNPSKSLELRGSISQNAATLINDDHSEEAPGISMPSTWIPYARNLKNPAASVIKLSSLFFFSVQSFISKNVQLKSSRKSRTIKESSSLRMPDSYLHKASQMKWVWYFLFTNDFSLEMVRWGFPDAWESVRMEEYFHHFAAPPSPAIVGEWFHFHYASKRHTAVSLHKDASTYGWEQIFMAVSAFWEPLGEMDSNDT